MCLSLIVNWYLKINNKCKSVRYTWLKKRFKFLLYSRGFDCIHNHPGSQQVRSKNRTSPGGPRLFCLVWGYSLSIIQRNRQDRNHIACTVCVRHTVNRSENYPKSRIFSASNIQRFNINKEIADFIMQRIICAEILLHMISDLSARFFQSLTDPLEMNDWILLICKSYIKELKW